MPTPSISATTETQYIADLLRPFEPQLPLPLLVERMNKIYHAHEARDYDRTHPEIFSVLPETWQQMLSALPNRDGWRILDFGCGTGFEASQALSGLGNRIETLTCYDPSPEMLALCKRRLESTLRGAFTCNIDEIATHAPYDLLLTNSLLHHLPDVNVTIETLLPLLTGDAFWLAGHEPSTRFHQNPQCCALLQGYVRSRRWTRLANPMSYIHKLKQLMGVGPDPLRRAGIDAYEQGLFNKRPSRFAVGRLVDFHVPHNREEVAAGRGFDFRRMEHLWRNTWSLKWTRTYSFMGPYKEVTISGRWRQRARLLAQSAPDDGSNFCCVWKRGNVGTDDFNEASHLI
jgi:SAM-dependent methyltransferase